jgi:hypothetical protein
MRTMTKIYLDTCSIQRPLDTLSQTRLRLEVEAKLGVLAQVKVGNVELISSTDLHSYQVGRTPRQQDLLR